MALHNVQHYNAMRPHRSLALDSPEGRKPVQRMPSQRVDSKPVLGGCIMSIGGPYEVLPPHGVAKARWLHFTRSEADIAAMRAVKAALDAHGILNPGVIFGGD